LDAAQPWWLLASGILIKSGVFWGKMGLKS